MSRYERSGNAKPSYFYPVIIAYMVGITTLAITSDRWMPWLFR